ncbi:hypothetical protein BDW66DRAFT_147185 [Aspergillus desertorum]
MCFYQPNPPGCTCAFYQLIQPCPSATTYPPPEPTKNPNPLVKVCGVREFAKGVGMRICLGCQSRYMGMDIMGLGGVGVGMGVGVGYDVSLGMGHTEFIGPGWHAGQQDEQRTGGLLKEKKKAGLTASATAPASISAATCSTGIALAAGTGAGTGRENSTIYGSSLMIRRRGLKSGLRRLVPYPNPISKKRMAVSSPLSWSAKEAEKVILAPTPTLSDLGNGTDKGECQGQRREQEQIQGCGRVLGELGEDSESRLLLLRYDTVFEATVDSLPPSVERETTTASANETAAEVREEKGIADAEKVTEHEVSDLPRIEEAHVLKIDNENQVGISGKHESMDNRVERLVMTLA